VEARLALKSYREDVVCLSARQAGSQMGVSHASVLDWESGAKSPNPLCKAEIERWTRGRVKAKDWPLSRREQRDLDTMREKKHSSAVLRAAARNTRGGTGAGNG
jgi:DNA-binding transcriptional regulator YdaS (Cro superfamily)